MTTPPKNEFLRFPEATPHDSAIDLWFDSQVPELGAMARTWFAQLRKCGPDVQELLHDGHPTVCVGDAAFAYVNVFTAHVNVGFFLGALLQDPMQLLQGTGKRGRHVKLKPGAVIEAAHLQQLIERAYSDIRGRIL